MSSAAMRRVRYVSTLLVASMIVGACHRAPPRPEAQTAAACLAEQERESDTRIHIDGPYMSTPRLGDSVIYIVNDREVWRGVYDPCHPSPGRHAALDHSIPATDSVVSLFVEHGREAAARYHIGGSRVTAYVIRTAPPPE